MVNMVFNKKIWLTVSIITLLLMSGAYIYQVNDLTRDTYLRDQYHGKLSQLQQGLKLSEITASQDNSLTQMNKLAQNKNFKEISQVEYVKAINSQMVTAEK